MLLIGCTAGAFTACSDGDDDQKPSCPITEYTVPSTAEIGGFYTVTGKGFEASAQLFLRNASGTETAAADQTVTAAGIECTVPSTLTAGVYTVVVKQNGSWDLGPVRLEAAQNPVSSVVLPAAIKLNKTLEIAGNGFTSASRIFLETADAAKTRTELTAVPSSTGISCTIPDGVAAGTYNVILKHNNIDWTLGENIPAAVYKRLTGISYAMSQTCDFSTVEGGVEAVKAILLEMVGNDQEMADMYFEMLFSEGTNVVSQLSLKYGSDNRVTAVQQGEGADAADWYTFSFDGDKVSALNKMYEDGESGIRAFSWVLNGGKVESSNVDFMRTVSGEVVSRPADFTWIYDAVNGQCTGVVYQSTGSNYVSFDFENGNYTAGGMFEYGDAGKKNNIFGVDVAKAIAGVTTSLDDDHALACFLGYDGKASLNLPTATMFDAMSEDDPAKAVTCTQDGEGYVTVAKWGGVGMDMMGIGVKVTSETILRIYLRGIGEKRRFRFTSRPDRPGGSFRRRAEFARSAIYFARRLRLLRANSYFCRYNPKNPVTKWRIPYNFTTRSSES